MEVCVASKLTTSPGSARRAHLIIAEARRLGLGKIRIERARLAAEFNGEPISVPLALMLADRGEPARTLLLFHQQLRTAFSRRH
jgi:hypothetical protein